MSGTSARIWVDADACPVAIKQILYRAADRTRTRVTLVANKNLRTPPSPWVDNITVLGGPDLADDRIVEELRPGDLVVTADIPLAARVVEKGGLGLDPRGEVYDEQNVHHRLSIRDFMADLRDQGLKTSGPAALGPRDKQAFANALDRWLATRG